jgi:hypothetical protein
MPNRQTQRLKELTRNFEDLMNQGLDCPLFIQCGSANLRMYTFHGPRISQSATYVGNIKTTGNLHPMKLQRRKFQGDINYTWI